jgi:hypothetical protein
MYHSVPKRTRGGKVLWEQGVEKRDKKAKRNSVGKLLVVGPRTPRRRTTKRSEDGRPRFHISSVKRLVRLDPARERLPAVTVIIDCESS